MATGTYAPFVDAIAQFCDDEGVPISGGRVYTFIAGTATPVATYSNVGLTTSNGVSVLLNTAGRPTSGAIFLTPGVAYDIDVKDSAGVSIVTRSNIQAVPTNQSDLDIEGTAGESLTAGQVVYLSDGSGALVAGRWYLADADQTYSSTTPLIGFPITDIASGSIGTIRLGGRVTGLSGLTAGTIYYVSETAGALTATAPANSRQVGQADSTTSIIVTANPPPNTLDVLQVQVFS